MVCTWCTAHGSATVESWEDPQADGTFEWITRETMAGEGCNPGDPQATPARAAESLCAFRNDTDVVSGEWPSYDGTGAETEILPGDRFFEVGVNVGHLLEITDPNYAYTTIRLWTPTDLAFGHFGEEAGS